MKRIALGVRIKMCGCMRQGDMSYERLDHCRDELERWTGSILFEARRWNGRGAQKQHTVGMQKQQHRV